MPTYEYECQACGTTFERFQSITAKPVRTCPDCGARRVKRLLGAGAGVIFRGSGFYQTDYRSEDYKRKAKAENGNGSAAKSPKSEKSSETTSKAAEASDS